MNCWENVEVITCDGYECADEEGKGGSRLPGNIFLKLLFKIDNAILL